VTVEESDTLYVGRPAGLALDPEDGSLYLTDRFAGRIVRIDRSGRPMRTYGRKGRGPGELMDIGVSFRWGEHLFALDDQRRMIVGFEAETGEFVGSWRLDGILGRAVPMPEGVWMGLLDTSRQTGAAQWTPTEGERRHFAPFPREYRDSQPLAGIFNRVALDRWSDSTASLFQGSDRIVLYRDTTPTDTLVVPVSRRKGVPADIVEHFQRVEFPEMFRSVSFAFDMKRLSDGRIAVLHYDQEIEGRIVHSVPYLSVSSPDRRSWCVDGELPISRVTQPHTLFRGDTLFVLDQHLDGDQATTRITAYTIDLSRCQWIPDPRKAR
jgi:hypothetical protein